MSVVNGMPPIVPLTVPPVAVSCPVAASKTTPSKVKPVMTMGMMEVLGGKGAGPGGVGTRLGANVGASVRLPAVVGAAVGATVVVLALFGAAVGTAVGAAVGAEVALASEGAMVGEIVGFVGTPSVGAVGEAVGFAKFHIHCCVVARKLELFCFSLPAMHIQIYLFMHHGTTLKLTCSCAR
jgi:hypothetical protein